MYKAQIKAHSFTESVSQTSAAVGSKGKAVGTQHTPAEADRKAEVVFYFLNFNCLISF